MFILLAQFGSSFPTPDYDEIAGVLRERGHKVWVATPDGRGHLVVHNGAETVAMLDKPKSRHGPLRSLPGLKRVAQWSAEWRFAVRLRRFIQRHQFDIAHLNRSKLIFFWMVPLWTSDRTRYVLDWRQIGERKYTGLLGGVKRVIAVQYRRIPSRYIYDRSSFLHVAGAIQVLGEEWARWATVVPLAVSNRFFSEHPDHGRLKDLDSPVRFVYIGTLNHVRRLERIILAAHKIVSHGNGQKSFEVTFIGPDKTNGHYQEIVDRLDLDRIVKIKSPLPYQDVPHTLRKYDVALAYVPEYPLDWQYHPTLKVLEYRAIGMPIIATDYRPNRDFVEDGVNGLLVDNSAEDIAKVMQRFINDRQFLERCMENARSMRQGVLWPEVSEMYERMYKRLLGQTEKL
jgi:glycosyltransferase involved in cell wall biosynthesis